VVGCDLCGNALDPDNGCCNWVDSGGHNAVVTVTE
jgi:hypothetical protein